MNTNNTERQITILTSMVVAVFFAYDIVGDFLEHSAKGLYFYTEVTIILMVIALVVYQFNKIIIETKEVKEVNSKLLAVQTELADIIEAQFKDWRLSPAEREITWLMIKGFSFHEISDLREVSEKTIHQQSASIYKKANVHNRHELISGFIEDFII